MDEDLKQHLTDESQWLRLLYMVLFVVIFQVAEAVISVVVVVQFLWVIVSGSRNANLLSLGSKLTAYARDVLAFLTYCSSAKPFPFGDWPEGIEVERSEAAPASPRPPEPPSAPDDS
ncbi:MAG: DUF4389 domain-containing protein [Pseudomonadales bacterium]